MAAGAGQPANSFGELLRQLRDEAGLTQEQLAAAATLSPRSISDLERGITRTARRETARLLADAFGLAGSNRTRFEAAARGRLQGSVLQPDEDGFGAPRTTTRTLPRDIAGFTGRAAELERLLSEVADVAPSGGVVGICAIGGMAGIGKTTLAVHAAHQFADRFPDGQLFVALHGHTPGQRPVDPVEALASLLLSAGFAASQIPADLDARAACWRDHLVGKRTLLVFDDAAGHEQVRPLLPGGAGCLVLITSRRRLAALEDAAVISLDTLAPDEAADLLARLAARPDVRPDDAGVDDITRLCGYLPLAIGMLGRQLHHHPAWTAAGLAADLAAAHEKLALLHAENVSVAAAFDLSYRDLTAGQRRLFRRLGLHPGTEIDARAAAALAGSSLATAARHLAGLYDLHLISEPLPGRYRLHDLIREHARTLATDDNTATRDAATGRLLDYYLHTALAASRHMPPSLWDPVAHSLPPARPPGFAPPMSTYKQAVEWLETEQANLHAAVVYAASSGQAQHAMLIPAAMFSFLDMGRQDKANAEHRIALDSARQCGDQRGEARALVSLGATQVAIRDLTAAAATFQQALAIYGELGDQLGQAGAINCLGFTYVTACDYRSAAASHRQALGLFQSLDYQLGQAEALVGLGSVHSVSGDYPAATGRFQQALKLFESIGHRHGQAAALSSLGAVQGLTGHYRAAAVTLSHARTLTLDLHDRYLQAYSLTDLGMVQRLSGDYRSATISSQKALQLFCDLHERDGEACARNELGLVQQLTGDYPAAADNHQQALKMFSAIGERHEQAQALNSLGELATRTDDSPRAYSYLGQALTLARELGTPLEEARALEGIGRVHLHDGQTGDGIACLEQALTIYRRIGVPQAGRIEEILSSVRTGKLL